MPTLALADLERNLWGAADVLRSSMPVSEYAPALLGLVLAARLYPEGFEAISKGRAFARSVQPGVKALLDELDLQRVLERAGPAPAASLVRTIGRMRLPSLATPVMLELFDHLLARFSDDRGGPGHQTPSGLNRLLARLATAVSLEGPPVIYDPACGFGGVLGALHASFTTPVATYGVEMNPTASAFATARGLILDEGRWDIRTANSLASDPHAGVRATHLACVPPFGASWAGLGQSVKTDSGRFRYGLPRRSDSTLLFMQDLLSKMREPSEGGARAVIVTAGRALWGGSSGEKKVRQHLFESDLVEAIVILPSGLFPTTGIQTYAWVLSNHKEPARRGVVRLIDGADFFVSGPRDSRRRLMADDQIEALVALLNADEGDLVRLFENDRFKTRIGDEVEYTVERITHLGFGLSREMARLSDQYKTCTVRPLKEVCLSIEKTSRSLGDSVHTVDSPLDAVRSLGGLKIVPDPALLAPEYLSMFFATDLGRRLLAALSGGSIVARIDPTDFGLLRVPVPKIQEQKEILATKARLDELAAVLARIEEELAANPESVADVNERVVPMLQALGRLSEADQVRERIRSGESKRVEFKQTYAMDIRTGQKADYVEKAALKTIVAFLNSDGGDLLIGVADDGSLPGLSHEIGIFHNGDTDKFLLHIKNRLKTGVGEQCYPLIDQRLVSVGGSLVLRVACERSDHPVFLDEEHFFVRTNPATDALTGRRMHEYIRTRFEP